MPPKAKFTQKEIIKKAWDLVREQGIEGLSARELGKVLGSSPRPIFTVFEGMDEVKDAIKNQAITTYDKYIQAGLGQDNALEGMAMAHIIFAMKEPRLFEFLFENKENVELYKQLCPLQSESYLTASKRLMTKYSLTEEKCKNVSKNIWLYAHGIATLVAGGREELDGEQIGKMIRDVFRMEIQAK